MTEVIYFTALAVLAIGFIKYVHKCEENNERVRKRMAVNERGELILLDNNTNHEQERYYH